MRDPRYTCWHCRAFGLYHEEGVYDEAARDWACLPCTAELNQQAERQTEQENYGPEGSRE